MVEVKEISKIGAEKRGKETLVVKLRSEEQRREVMKRKSNLRRRKMKIWEDWTVLEKKMRWKLERIAREEEMHERRIDRRYGKLRVENIWWF